MTAFILLLTYTLPFLANCLKQPFLFLAETSVGLHFDAFFFIIIDHFPHLHQVCVSETDANVCTHEFMQIWLQFHRNMHIFSFLPLLCYVFYLITDAGLQCAWRWDSRIFFKFCAE